MRNAWGPLNKYSFIGYLFAVSLLSGCEQEQATPEHITIDPISRDKVVHLDQGWDDDTATKAHHISFGSRLLPYNWLRALESEESQTPWLNEARVERLGFLHSPKSPNNPRGLPVGFTIDKDTQGVEWAGLGCAACHTGEVHFNQNKIRLEGGQGLINFSLFEKEITQALVSTNNNQNKYTRFLQHLKNYGDDTSNLRDQLKNKIAYLTSRQHTNATKVDYGKGRLDAFGQIFNTVAVEVLQIPENVKSPDAPVSFPVLWNAPHFDLVQWNGSAPNAGPGPLLQNVTTAIAVYGQIEVVNSQAKLGYKSSVNIKHLKDIQNWLYRLKSPQWPSDILGELDAVKVSRGQQVYTDNCLSCHALVDRENKKNKIRVTLTPLEQVKTDPKMVSNFLDAKAKSGVLEGKKLLWLAGDKIAAEAKSIDLVAHIAVGAALNHPLQTIESTVESYHSVYKASVDNNPNYYKARPLTGIWASAPYLHNGSVLTLAELLTPAENRRQTFYIGDRQLDLERVGLQSTQNDTSTIFDTRLPGNSNQGHEFGVHLDATDKTALLEYLKSL